MVFSANSRFSNSAVGIPQVAGDVDIFAQHSLPRFALGHRIQRQDGSTFVYSHFGADTAASVMCSTDLSESTSEDVDIIAPASAVNTTDGTIGSKFIEATIASISADEFAGGYFSTEDDTGEGYTYRIKGNTATGDPTTGNIRLEFYDKVQVAIVAASTANIISSLYSNLEAATTTDIAAAGVSCAAMDVSAAAYGWVQVAGVATVLTSGTQVIGSGTTLAAAGALAPEAEAGILESPATTLVVGATGEHSIVRLTLN